MTKSESVYAALTAKRMSISCVACKVVRNHTLHVLREWTPPSPAKPDLFHVVLLTCQVCQHSFEGVLPALLLNEQG
jgi:hypothetical protein